MSDLQYTTLLFLTASPQVSLEYIPYPVSNFKANIAVFENSCNINVIWKNPAGYLDWLTVTVTGYANNVFVCRLKGREKRKQVSHPWL